MYEVALSRIADVITNGNLIKPKLDGFKRALYNAGFKDQYDKNEFKLTEKAKQENWETKYCNNDRSYSAILNILYEIVENSDSIIKLFNSIFEEILIDEIFNNDFDKIIGQDRYSSGFDIVEKLKKKGLEGANELLRECPTKDFRLLKANLNLLALDISFTEEMELTISPLTLRENEEKVYKKGMLRWLEEDYVNISKSYENAVKMCSEGNNVECLSNCRNVITGIFSYDKLERTKWYTGLKVACKDDKNINNVSSPSNIPSWKNGRAHDSNVDKRYNYPRFKTISQIYSFLSDLGPHIDEANIVDGVVDVEYVTDADAFWGLRLTESILIWLYQNQYKEI